MADKKTGKSAASHKKAVQEFQKEGNPDFQKSGGSDFQPRASDVFQEKTGASQKPGASKSHAKKEYGETFGQNVQKSGADTGQEEKAAFTKAENTFSGQDNSGQTEENGKRQEEKEDYHRRDTYRQSQEKGKYHKKRVQREHKHREKAKDTVFTEDAGKVFTEDRASEFTGSEKLKKKQKQAQKAAEKVKKARGKLPKKREYTLQRVFDEETGKGKYVVVPLDKEKPFKQESLSKTTMRRMQTESRNFVHGKIAENEKENSAVEGAHKTEQKAEELIGFVKRHYKGKEARQRAKIAKLEKKQFQKEVNFQYQKFLEENPQMQKKALQKRLQKQHIKREYMKARQKGAATKAAQEAVSKTANTATAIAKKLQEIASKNAGVLITVGIMAVLLIMIMTSVSSCGAMFADTQSTVLAASYLSEPAEIDATDLQFTRLELDLQNEIDNIETDYPGYDEYSYNLGEIGHNPFTLIGYLSAVHTEFTASEVES
ncbi:MAG: CD1108 family mobile element protein, partial [Lachnospiraceae bacterium]